MYKQIIRIFYFFKLIILEYYKIVYKAFFNNSFKNKKLNDWN